jgi:hypothetical protein
MTEAQDLFARLGFGDRAPALAAPAHNPRTVGHGNAQAILDIAQGMTRDEVRDRFKAGAYPDASGKIIADNLAYYGR